ncbi:MAG: hypothetical protein HQL71_02965 [Magnetococcales bacterium]|nr:hypothetical protein [Magnetococcales bacterium]
MPQFIVLTPLRHNAKVYSPGAAVDMTQQQAAALIRAAAIAEKPFSQTEVKTANKELKKAEETDLSKAINELDVKDKSLWMKDGRPRTEALIAIVGYRITAKERDINWQQWKEENRP